MSLENSRAKLFLLGSLAALGLVSLACRRPVAVPAPPTETATAASPNHAHGSHGQAGATHDGWWCPEHGVPEEICGLCDPKVAQKMKANGDWCQTHDRPDSQCFVCHPELEARFAALYEAKFGQPPK
jgi:hypothetical protein